MFIVQERREVYEYFVSNPGLTKKPSQELNLPLFPKPTLTLKQYCTICQKLHFWYKIKLRHISTKIIPPKAAPRFSNGLGHLVVGSEYKAMFGVLTPFLITVNDYLPNKILKPFQHHRRLPGKFNSRASDWSG